ncbi:UDP-galactopyranose mutase [Campylobacter lari]|uniref:UDP-galactopyranose mutase n=1 Tax=Campylobacter lari TaxID=201 RepID=UPI0021F6F640|nr:UDP-galactopyranose mutase [Campylobacter lari]EGK8096202.1 UDP-galactopyranose mutase [Campylobacter lari]MCW0187801.1 UDP-galactopyranose mutase [Campylobacter lari]MCW0231612.1 UDP-galactopyranose mutase [Campylobacter lari]
MYYFIVGAGITGSVLARSIVDHLSDAKVVLIEKRRHIGGNMYDYIDKYGIMVHKYGPHTFHTNSKSIFEFINRFSDWIPYKSSCMAMINDKLTPCPFNYQTIDDFYNMDNAKKIKNALISEFKHRRKVSIVELINSKSMLVKEFATFLFENDYKLYTAKQWDIDVNEIDVSILKRVPIRLSYNKYYFDDLYQVLPSSGYISFFEKLLDHKNIKVITNENALDSFKIDFKTNKILFEGREFQHKLIYTGPLDELMNYQFGVLPYRSLRFKWYHEDIDLKQQAPIVVYPQVKDFTRVVEYKQMPYQKCKGTTYSVEYPEAYVPNLNEAYYPILTQSNMDIYYKYKKSVRKIHNLYILGRLADYKYYNMDQAIKRALLFFRTNIFNLKKD